IYLIAGLALFCVALILVLYKEFKLVSFDPDFARVQGWPAMLLDLVMMLLIAIAVIIGLPAVGVVLMASLLILPGAAARFWTEDYRRFERCRVANSSGGRSGARGSCCDRSVSCCLRRQLRIILGAVIA